MVPLAATRRLGPHLRNRSKELRERTQRLRLEDGVQVGAAAERHKRKARAGAPLGCTRLSELDCVLKGDEDVRGAMQDEGGRLDARQHAQDRKVEVKVAEHQQIAVREGADDVARGEGAARVEQ